MAKNNGSDGNAQRGRPVRQGTVSPPIDPPHKVPQRGQGGPSAIPIPPERVLEELRGIWGGLLSSPTTIIPMCLTMKEGPLEI
jgi:hypothetical protein